MTGFFGNSHFFHRTIVALDGKNNFSYTPTENYGGDNGRAALLGSNGVPRRGVRHFPPVSNGS